MVVHQRSLFGFGDAYVDEAEPWNRVVLDDSSWVDVGRRWFRGADDVLDALVSAVAWGQGRRPMYDREVDDPRLSCWYPARTPLPHPSLERPRAVLEERYGRSFGAVGLNYYRDGRDSVAFHRDRELRTLDDTIIAIVTLGARRPFLIRPLGGGRSVDFAPASGDLLVMGGACQQGFEHSVPKVARAGPRISVTWRWPSPRVTTTSCDVRPRPIRGSRGQTRS
jgi:alkylated DNA repair dioxygenase AlkB